MHELTVRYVKNLRINQEILFLSQSSKYRSKGIIFVMNSSKKVIHDLEKTEICS